jgi:hypothetical protein
VTFTRTQPSLHPHGRHTIHCRASEVTRGEPDSQPTLAVATANVGCGFAKSLPQHGRVALAKAMATTKTKTKTTKPSTAKLSTVEVATDPQRKKRFEKLQAALRSAKLEELRGFDEYWENVAEIVEAGLHVYGGYDTAEAFVKAETEQNWRSALRYMRVAKHASPNEEQKYGVAKIDAALSYIEAKLGAPVRGTLPIRLDALKVTVERDGADKRLGLDALTVRELNTATRALLAKSGSDARTRRSPIEQAFAKSLAGEKVLKETTVRFVDGHLSFSKVPLAHLDAFMKRVRATEWKEKGPTKKTPTKKTPTKKTPTKKTPTKKTPTKKTPTKKTPR